MTLLTHDSISLRKAGIVRITQPKKGHRFTLDSLLLVDFCRIKTRDRVLEPGAGTGIISLLLAKKFPQARFVADEVEPRAYALLKKNIEANGLGGRIESVDKDLKELARSLSPAAFDVIIANPPYTQFGTGRLSPLAERQTARHDRSASLPLWLNLQTMLKNRGRYVLVFPARRTAELVSLLKEKKLEPKRIRFVQPRADTPASLILIEAAKGGGAGVEIMPPLIVHEKDGGYTDELRKIYDL